MVETTLETFATHNSASVQATLYIMCEKVLRDNADVADIKYELPNKVRCFRMVPPGKRKAHPLSPCSTTLLRT